MQRPRLPKELRKCINQIANQRAISSVPGMAKFYRKNYLLEKAKITLIVNHMLESGDTPEKIIEALRDRRREMIDAVRKLMIEIE